MIIGTIDNDVALQICDNDSFCNDKRKLNPNPTKTRLGYCSWCWSSIK